MLAMRALLVVFAMLIFASGIAAQTIQPCTQISIESVEKEDPETPVVFTARVNNISSTETLKYRWQISVGTITDGQGSPRIVVDTVGLGGQSIKATLEVAGHDWKCSVESKSVAITLVPFICGLAFDQYGDIRFEDEKARLDNFAIQLANQPTARGAIIAFAGNPTYKGEAAFRLQRAKNYLVNVRKIPPNRLVTTDVGYRADFTISLYIVPDGATLPVLDSMSLPISEVKFTKPNPRLNRKK